MQEPASWILPPSIRGLLLQVNLTKPDWVVVAEALTVAGSGVLVGMAVVPASLVVTKPKLAFKTTAVVAGKAGKGKRCWSSATQKDQMLGCISESTG